MAEVPPAFDTLLIRFGNAGMGDPYVFKTKVG